MNFSRTEQKKFNNLINYCNLLEITKATKLPVPDNDLYIEKPIPLYNVQELLKIAHIEDNKMSIGHKNQICKRCPLEILIISIYYLERIVEEGVVLNKHTRFSFLWFCCILAHKYWSDDPINPIQLSMKGGFEEDTYPKIEIWLLQILDWKLTIPDSNYHKLVHIATQNKRRYDCLD